MKRKHIKKIAAIVCSAAVVFGVGTLSVFAALKYLRPDAVAEKLNDNKLMAAFSSEDAIPINETQSSGGYDFTLLGIVSGKNISEYLVESDNTVLDDRTYCVVAIEKSDKTPFPDRIDEMEDMPSFLISPLIEGYAPYRYNIFTMNGAYSEFVEDGVLYRLVECDNVEAFADHNIRLCVLGETFYNTEAYTYDEASGSITRNESYEGINLLFDLPLDPSKADPQAAAATIQEIDHPTEEAETEEETQKNPDDPGTSEKIEEILISPDDLPDDL